MMNLDRTGETRANLDEGEAAMPFVDISKCSVCESAYGPYSFSARSRRQLEFRDALSQPPHDSVVGKNRFCLFHASTIVFEQRVQIA